MARPKATEKKRSNGDGGVWQLETGRWRWEIVLGYVTKPDGTRSRKTKSGTAKNETEAKKALTLARADKERGTLATPDRVTLTEWLAQWLEGKKATITNSSKARYAGIIKNHLIPKLGDKKLQALKPLDLRNFYNDLVEIGLTPKGIRSIHGVLFSALKQAVSLELIMRNVADVARPELPRQDNNAKAAKAWTATEAKTFLTVARGHHLFAMFYLMLGLGLRRGEVCGLRWSSVDLERKTLTVQDNLITIGSRLAISTPKTMKSRRTINLSSEMLEVLRLHQAAQAQRHLEYGVSPEQDWLFTTTVGTAVRPDNIRRVFKSLCEVARVRRVRLHDLRHTWASLSRRAGVPLEVVSEQLGHSRPSFTGDVYSHTYTNENRAINLSELLADRPRDN
jgi:integrase